ncbi:hypothetical protein BH23PLA1_BH23PLA1_11700 [soil metagenome]
MMSQLAEQDRRPDTRSRRPIEERPSVREVCLLGGFRDDSDRKPGARLQCEGRLYRVAARNRPGPDDIRNYVHLAALPDPIG